MTEAQRISAIIPTVGRAKSLWRCLESLSKQTVRVSEVVVVHCGDDAETMAVTKDARWAETVHSSAILRLNTQSMTTFC